MKKECFIEKKRFDLIKNFLHKNEKAKNADDSQLY